MDSYKWTHLCKPTIKHIHQLCADVGSRVEVQSSAIQMDNGRGSNVSFEAERLNDDDDDDLCLRTFNMQSKFLDVSITKVKIFIILIFNFISC